MANLLTLNSIVELKLFCTFAGQISVNVRHYKVTAIAGSGANDTDAVTAFGTAFAALYKPVLNTQATYFGASVQIIKPAALIAVTSAVGTGAGTGGAAGLPPTTCGLIKLTTSLAGRANRGRVYVPFPAETDNTAAGSPEAVYLGLLATLAAQFILTVTITTGANSSDLAPGIYHRASGTITGIAGAVIRTEWASQDRRSKLRHGDAPPF